jgi:DNA helicase IV
VTAIHPELEAEQAYLDRAHNMLDRGHADAEASIAQHQPGNRATAQALRRALDILKNAKGTGALIFGRADAVDGRMYVGRRRVYDPDKNLLVVSWHAPAAAIFYESTPDDPRGLVLKRSFVEEERRFIRIVDDFVAEVGRSVVAGTSAPAYSDALLAELERSRDGAMRDVIATIQAEQYRIIRSDDAGLLVVQGGPGTGKTVVGLHRAAWLAYNGEAIRRAGMLVVAPSSTLLSFISGVLPLLGVTDVMQAQLSALYGGDARISSVLRQ